MKFLIGSRKCHRENGQTLVMFVFFLIVLILFVGLGIDLGFAYVTKANLSKAVDAAALTAMKNISLGTFTAQDIGSATFAANYGKPGRDVNGVSPSPSFVWSTDSSSNTILDVKANTTINTFFIRVLPTWKTLSVSANAQTTRAKLVMSLVLDRSGSMGGNGGAAALPGAVANFINLFDDTNDRASMSSFSAGSTVDVTMGQPFKTAIKNAANSLSFNGWTASERGLTNGLAQNNTVTVLAGENVIKVIVFFSDGLANTWYWSGFNCGARDMGPDRSLYDPTTGNSASSGCTVPNSIPSIDGINTVTTSDQCGDMYDEAEKRAERIAYLARAAGNIVYAIGMGNPGGATECGRAPLNPNFLKSLANTTDSPTFDNTQPVGDYAIAANASQLNEVFQTIAAKILLRLTQ